MVVDHAVSMEFSFGSLLHRNRLPLVCVSHTNLLFFIRYQRLMHAGRTLPILDQILGFYHFFGVFIISHEEGVVLLFLQVFVALVVGFAYK